MKLPENAEADAGRCRAKPCTANAIKTALPGITLIHDKVALEPANDWPTLSTRHGLCFVTVVERHGKSAGNVAMACSRISA